MSEDGCDVPANSSRAVPRQSLSRPDGKKYSTQPRSTFGSTRPAFQYIGMIARKRSNNDTAYSLQEGRRQSARGSTMSSAEDFVDEYSADETLFEKSISIQTSYSSFQTGTGSTAATTPADLVSRAVRIRPFNPNPSFRSAQVKYSGHSDTSAVHSAGGHRRLPTKGR